MNYKIIVIHELGLFAEYVIYSESEYKARKEAKQKFIDDFCNGKTKHKITTKIT